MLLVEVTDREPQLQSVCSLDSGDNQRVKVGQKDPAHLGMSQEGWLPEDIPSKQ